MSKTLEKNPKKNKSNTAYFVADFSAAKKGRESQITQMKASHYWARTLFVQAAFSWHLVRDVHGW